MRYVSLLLAALVIVLGAHAVTRADAPAGVQKWQYQVLGIDHHQVAGTKLSEAGQDGWELVSCVQTMFGGGPGHLLFVFKRPLK